MKIIKRTAALTAAFMLLALPAFASFNIEYDIGTRTLSASGEAENSGSRFVTLSLMPLGRTAEETEDTDSENVIYKTVETDENGGFQTDFILPGDFDNGTYILRAYDSAQFGLCYIGYVGTDGLTLSMSELNGAASGAQVISALKNLPGLGLDELILNSYSGNIGGYISGTKPAGGYTVSTLLPAYYRAEALAKIRAGAITLSQALLQYQAYTGVDYKTQYASLPEPVKEKLDSLFSKSTENSVEFSALYRDLTDTAKMLAAGSFEELQSLYLTYAGANGISLSKYNALPSDYYRDQVFIKLYSQIGSASSMTDINSLFESALSSVNIPGTGTGSGSGGGGGGGGAATYVEPESSGASSVFTDVYGHWAESYIIKLKESGAADGYEDKSFRPDNTVTRAEFVKMLSVLRGLPGGTGTVFTDVAENDWFYNAVMGAYGSGIVKGTSASAFSPNANITRQDAAVILQRAWGLSGEAEIQYADRSEISDYAVSAVGVLSSKKVLNGYEDNTIRPAAFMTRGETAAVLVRMMNVTE